MSEEIKKVEGEPEGDAKIGNVKISNDVIATVAGIATGEVNGVAGMGGSVVGGIAEILGGKRNRGKGVKVELDGDSEAEEELAKKIEAPEEIAETEE